MFTFIGGAAVGSLLTYMAKNQETSETVENFIDAMGRAFTDLLRRITPDTQDINTREEVCADKSKKDKTKTVKKTARTKRVAKKKSKST